MEPERPIRIVPGRGLSRGWKILLRIASSGVCLLIASWIVLYFVGSSQIEAALAELREGGYATSLADLASAPLPSEENAASHFTAAFDLHPDPEEESPALARANEEGFAALTVEEKAELRGILQKASGCFERLRLAGGIRTCRYERDYRQGLEMQLPEVAGAMRTVRLLRHAALASAEMGDVDAAREAVALQLAVAEGYRREPMLVLQLVRLAMVSQAVETVESCVRADTGVSDLRAWLSILPPPESLDGAAELGLRGEVASGAQFVRRPSDSTSTADSEGVAAVGSDLLAPYWKLAGSRYLRNLGKLLRMSELPYAEARPALDAFLDDLQNRKRLLDVWSLLLLPSFGKALENQVQAKVFLAVARAGLQAEIQRAGEGRYPERIDTTDPSSGAPLRWDLRLGTISSALHPERGPAESFGEKPVWRIRKPTP